MSRKNDHVTQKSTFKNRKFRILILVKNFSTSDISDFFLILKFSFVIPVIYKKNSEYQWICRQNRGLKIGCFFIFLERFQVAFMISGGLL